MKKILARTKKILQLPRFPPAEVCQIARIYATMEKYRKVEKLLKKFIPQNITEVKPDWLAIGSCLYAMMGDEDRAKRFRNRLRELPCTGPLPTTFSKVLFLVCTSPLTTSPPPITNPVFHFYLELIRIR